MPRVQCTHRAWQGFGDNFVLNRTEKHVGNGTDKAGQDEQKQGRDQHQSPQLLAPQRAMQASLQRPAVRRPHRAVCSIRVHGAHSIRHAIVP